jgi:hypothetical protein
MKVGDKVKTCDGEVGVIVGEETNRVEYRYGVKIGSAENALWFFKSELQLIKNDERNHHKTPA